MKVELSSLVPFSVPLFLICHQCSVIDEYIVPPHGLSCQLAHSLSQLRRSAHNDQRVFLLLTLSLLSRITKHQWLRHERSHHLLADPTLSLDPIFIRILHQWEVAQFACLFVVS